MAEKKRRSGCLKFFVIVLILIGLAMGGTLLYLFKSQPVASARQFASAATGGMLIVTLDPSDPELAKFLDSISEGQLDFTKKSNQYAGKMIIKAIDPEIIIVSRFEPGGETKDWEEFIGEHEAFGAAVQFRRFSSFLYRGLKKTAQTGKSKELKFRDGAVRISDGQIPVDPAMTTNAFLIASSEPLIESLVEVSHKAGNDTEPLFPSDRHRELFERVEKSLGQVKGYFVNDDERLGVLIDQLRRSGGLDPSVAELLQPEVIEEIDNSLTALIVEGELLGADILELKLSLICADAERASLLKGALDAQLVDKANKSNPNLKMSAAQKNAEVEMTFRITELKKMLE